MDEYTLCKHHYSGLEKNFPLRGAWLRMDTMVERWFEKVPQSVRPSSLCRFMRQCYWFKLEKRPFFCPGNLIMSESHWLIAQDTVTDATGTLFMSRGSTILILILPWIWGMQRRGNPQPEGTPTKPSLCDWGVYYNWLKPSVEGGKRMATVSPTGIGFL